MNEIKHTIPPAAVYWSKSLLERHLEEGTLIRGKWTGRDAQGRETACLLAAIWPECGEKESAHVCPAYVMPPWLAELTPWIDDAGTTKNWPNVIRRYASLANRWHVLDDAGWRRALLGSLAAIVTEAKSHTKDESSIACCESVIALCKEGAAAGDPRWEEARKAAAETERTVWGAVWAAAAAGAASVYAAYWATDAASADRIIVGILDAIEKEIESEREE